MTRVAVLGSSGFVGGVVGATLRSAGQQVVAVRAPRLRATIAELDELAARLAECPAADVVSIAGGPSAELARKLQGADAVVNAAGLAWPDCTDPGDPRLLGANALLPLVVRAAQLTAGVPLFVHVSSAAVCGRRPLSAGGPVDPLTAYAASKARGEHLLNSTRGAADDTVHVYRATSVHGAGRVASERGARALNRLPVVPLARPFGQSTYCHTEKLGESVRAIVARGAGGTSLEPPHLDTAGVVRLMRPGARILTYPRWLGDAVFAMAGRLARSDQAIARLRRAEVLLQGQPFADHPWPA